MKKYLLLILACLLVVTGCGKDDDTKKADGKSGSIVCTKTTEEDGAKVEETITVNYKNDKVTTVKEVMLENVGKDYQELTYSMTKSVFESSFKDVEGLDVKVEKDGKENVKITMDVDYSKIDAKNLKEVFGDDSDEEVKTDITIDEFKEKNLEGYTCK